MHVVMRIVVRMVMRIVCLYDVMRMVMSTVMLFVFLLVGIHDNLHQVIQVGQTVASVLLALVVVRFDILPWYSLKQKFMSFSQSQV